MTYHRHFGCGGQAAGAAAHSSVAILARLPRRLGPEGVANAAAMTPASATSVQRLAHANQAVGGSALSPPIRSGGLQLVPLHFTPLVQAALQKVRRLSTRLPSRLERSSQSSGRRAGARSDVEELAVRLRYLGRGNGEIRRDYAQFLVGKMPPIALQLSHGSACVRSMSCQPSA